MNDVVFLKYNRNRMKIFAIYYESRSILYFKARHSMSCINVNFENGF